MKKKEMSADTQNNKIEPSRNLAKPIQYCKVKKKKKKTNEEVKQKKKF